MTHQNNTKSRNVYLFLAGLAFVGLYGLTSLYMRSAYVRPNGKIRSKNTDIAVGIHHLLAAGFVFLMMVSIGHMWHQAMTDGAAYVPVYVIETAETLNAFVGVQETKEDVQVSNVDGILYFAFVYSFLVMPLIHIAGDVKRWGQYMQYQQRQKGELGICGTIFPHSS